MPTHERSTFGCWTCRIRKKKCDEVYPLCSACQIRGITCYGYGPKPDWMDGREREKKVLDDLKRVVKENLKQKRSYISGRPQQNVAPPSLHAYHLTQSVSTALTPPAETAPFLTKIHSPDTRPHFLPSPPQSSNDVSTSRRDGKEFETTLLMNYLDHVFPLQYNCYCPPVTELGRGWLLALLTRTKPLYHAALALSAFYMHSILQKMGKSLSANEYWEMMKTHHSLAFKELQIKISELKDCRHLKSSIETLACIIQLISFELLRGSSEGWQIHLSAASSLIPTLLAHLSSQLPRFGHNPLAFFDNDEIDCISDEWKMLQDAPLPDTDAIACDFLLGTFVWFDIISSSSIRAQPYLENNEDLLLGHRIQLDKIMGCKNWAMIFISRISALARWKSDQQRAGRLSLKELTSRSTEIEKGLNEGLARNLESIGKPISHPESAACQRLGVASSKTNLVLTRIFAWSALTYLHITVSGAHPSLPEIQDSVAQTFEAFRYLPDPTLLRNLVWPFCVTGCMASKQDEEWFYIVMKLAETEGEGCPGNLWKAWEIVQECWRMRAEQGGNGRGIDWVDVMEKLDIQILLV